MTTLGLKQIIFHVIPAKAGIQINPGFRVKPGMTDILRQLPELLSF